jgi:triosephosphate isomerase
MADRTKFLAGNWKMHKTKQDTLEFFTTLRGDVPKFSKDVELAFAVPATLLEVALLTTQQLGVKILAQNCHWEKQGAFTGETSVGMLQDIGAHGSLVGHSERRQYFGETDQTVGKKWNALSLAGLLPVVCLGETKQERERGATMDVVRQQFVTALSQVSSEARASEFVIAYEPVWAIGTGLTATPQEAQDVHEFIRGLIAKAFDQARANSVRIIYGGSMNGDNAKDLLQKADIDGGLIGGASLKPDEFAKIVSAVL